MTARTEATWTKIPGPHLPRSSHSVCVIAGKAYIFGGEIQPRQPVDNAMHIVDIETGECEEVAAKGDAPAPRVGHTGAAVGNDIYVFGGRGGKDMTPLGESGAVYVFSTTARTWSRLQPTSESYPIARSYHSSTATSTHILIHGGCPPPPSGRLADVWAFDIASHTWTVLPEAPGKGRGGTAIAVLDGKLWRFGGFDGVGELGGGVDCLNLEKALHGADEDGNANSGWGFIPYGDATGAEAGKSAGPGARSVTALIPSTAGSGPPKLLVIMGEGKPSPTGGHDAAGGFYDDVWSFDPTSGKWEQVVIASGGGPGPRGWFGADVHGEGAVVWGGLNGANEREGDGWVLSFQ